MKKLDLSEKLKHLISDLSRFVVANYYIVFFIFAAVIKSIYFNFEIGTLPKYPLGYLYISALPAFFFVPLLYLKKRKLAFSYLLSLLFSTIVLIDFVYVRYYSSLPTIAHLQSVGMAEDIMPAIYSLFKWSDLLLFSDLLVIFLSRKYLLKKSNQTVIKSEKIYASVALALFLSLFTYVFFNDRSTHLADYVNRALDNKVVTERYGLLGAHFIDIFRNLNKGKEKISEEERRSVLSWFEGGEAATKNEFTEKAKGKNVIMLQVESLHAAAINKTINGQEITPNLNKLYKESHYFENHFFEMGLGSTSDTDFTVNASLYPLKDSAVFVRYGKGDYFGLPTKIREEGYSAYAYHAFNKSFWNRDVALRSLGYEKFYAKESYPNGEVINMGLNDEDFLLKTAQYIKEQPKPSFSYAITLTSHYPFWMPEAHRLITLDSQKYQGSSGYLYNIRYADEAIGKFIKKLKSDGLYDDSVFIVYGDHPPKTESYDYDGGRFEKGDFLEQRVPLFIKLPGQKENVLHKEVSSHIDIAPTIANLLGTKMTLRAMGRDLFSAGESFYASVLYFPYSLVTNGNYSFKAGSYEGEGECYIGMDLKQKAPKEKCDGLWEKKTQEQKYSSLIIKNNLFNFLSAKDR